jgi:hypothetical protein
MMTKAADVAFIRAGGTVHKRLSIFSAAVASRLTRESDA